MGIALRGRCVIRCVASIAKENQGNAVLSIIAKGDLHAPHIANKTEECFSFKSIVASFRWKSG